MSVSFNKSLLGLGVGIVKYPKYSLDYKPTHIIYEAVILFLFWEIDFTLFKRRLKNAK